MNLKIWVLSGAISPRQDISHPGEIPLTMFLKNARKGTFAPNFRNPW